MAITLQIDGKEAALKKGSAIELVIVKENNALRETFRVERLEIWLLKTPTTSDKNRQKTLFSFVFGSIIATISKRMISFAR